MKIGLYLSGLFTAKHGGGCCGISHLSEFPKIHSLSQDEKVAYIRKAILNALKANKRLYLSCWANFPEEDITLETARHAIEVVLIDDQIPIWGGALMKVGFKKVFSFYNTNSTNTCHVFFYETNRPAESQEKGI